MYSRIPRQPPRPTGMPSRPTSGQTVYRRAVTPPPNYSGHMFAPDGVFPDGLEPAPAPLSEARPRFDDLPSVSGLPVRGGDLPPEREPDGRQEPPPTPDATTASPPGEDTAPASPVLLDRAHFPLGHGLGEEELLLLGLILFLLHEDRSSPPSSGDNDLFLTLLILGFLLFCG